jgi:hypothetical protein
MRPIKIIVFLLSFIFCFCSISQNFSNKDLENLAGDFSATGQVITLSDGFLIQISEYKYTEEETVSGWTNWVIKLSKTGDIKWNHSFDQGMSSTLMSSFIETDDGYIGAVTQGKPELIFINKKGKIKKRIQVDSLSGIQRIQSNDKGGIQFIGKKVIFEGFVPSKFNPDMIYMSTVVGFYKIELDHKWKNISSIKIDSVEFEDDGNEYPIVSKNNKSFFLPWKNGDLFINNEQGILKNKVPLYYDKKVKEVIYENFRINHKSNFIFSRNVVEHDPNRHLARIELIEMDSKGKIINTIKVSGPLKNWNSRNDMIQTKDHGYLYMMYTDKLSLIKKNEIGKTSWIKLSILSQFYLHMSVAENSDGDIFVLTLKKTESGSKPHIMHFDSKGGLKN